jgi:hypothetical protein
MTGFFMLATLFWAFLASLSYIGATLVMKHWADLPLWAGGSGALLLLVLGCAAEVVVLQRARFAEVVILIISLEVVMALALSRHLLGESYGTRELLGILLLGVGAGLLLWQPGVAEGAGQTGPGAPREVRQG